MKAFEKKSLLNFIAIFFLGFLLLFTLLASLFYLQESKRLSSEARMQQHVKYIECKAVRSNEQECQKLLQVTPVEFSVVFRQIVYAFVISLLFIIPISILLGYISLKPVRRATLLLDSVMEQITHDMNTPMSAIKINASSIVTKTEDILQKKAKRIVASAKQIERMQANLQALVLEEKRALYLEHFSITLVIYEAMETLTGTYPDVDLVYDGKESEVYADKTDMLRVFINIIENSIKYNKNNNEIRITTDGQKIQIVDMGIGIKDITKVFKNHYRETLLKPGLGIGLAATYQLCKNNACEIKIESEYTKGTKVILTFLQVSEDA